MIRSCPLSDYSQARQGLFRAPPGNRQPKSPRCYAYWTSQAGKGLVDALVWVVPVFTRQPGGQRCCRGRRRMFGLNDESPAVPHAAFARGFLRLSACGSPSAAFTRHRKLEGLFSQRRKLTVAPHPPQYLTQNQICQAGFLPRNLPIQPFRLRIICAVELIHANRCINTAASLLPPSPAWYASWRFASPASSTDRQSRCSSASRCFLDVYNITFYVYSLFPLSVGLAFNNSSSFPTSLLPCPVPHTPAGQRKVG